MMLVQRASQEEEFFTSQILIPDVKFNDNLIGWMLATQCWNKARVYSTVTLVLTGASIIILYARLNISFCLHVHRAQLLLTTSLAVATRRLLIMRSPLKGMNTNNILINKLNHLIMNSIMKPQN